MSLMGADMSVLSWKKRLASSHSLSFFGNFMSGSVDGSLQDSAVWSECSFGRTAFAFDVSVVCSRCVTFISSGTAESLVIAAQSSLSDLNNKHDLWCILRPFKPLHFLPHVQWVYSHASLSTINESTGCKILPSVVFVVFVVVDTGVVLAPDFTDVDLAGHLQICFDRQVNSIWQYSHVDFIASARDAIQNNRHPRNIQRQTVSNSISNVLSTTYANFKAWTWSLNRIKSYYCSRAVNLTFHQALLRQ